MSVNERPSSRKSQTFVFAGGGSGGHISPGLAIAERLTDMGTPTHRAGSRGESPGGCVFLCSSRAIDAQMLESAGATFHPLPARPPSVRPMSAIRFLRSFARSKSIARERLRACSADHVIALGGFAAAPVVAAAQSLGIPITLINLDDPPGRANRWIARRADHIWSAIELSSHPAFATRTVGMPIRHRALAATFGDTQSCRKSLGLDPDGRTLLVTGASQGAGSINELMIALVEQHPERFIDWQILHLAGDGGETHVRDAYAKTGIRAIVLPFLDEIGRAWGAADVAVSRAGASSVAEAAANCVPTLFLPYPYHRDRHQQRNAQPLVDRGEAVMATDHIDVNANLLDAGEALDTLMRDPGLREKMKARLAANRAPDAATTIAELLLDGHRSERAATVRERIGN